jgi:4-amino-4-deoxyprephenate dehydrogenase
MTLSRVMIPGGLGQVGQLMAQTLTDAGREVILVDVRPRPEENNAARYVQTDVTRLDDDLISAVDCIVMCLPERAALRAAPAILEAMPEGALWVDTLSVKQNVCGLLRGYKEKLELISINPMFAPALGFAGNSVAFVEISGGPKSEQFAHILRSQGANVQMVTPETHDRLTAAIQVATHAAILSFGVALLELDYDVAKGSTLATPPHLLLLSLLQRLSTANPEVYWDIQHHHPYAASVRESLNRALKVIDTAATEDSPREFNELFERLRQLLSSQANGPAKSSPSE